MVDEDSTPIVSVVTSTRNRVDLLKVALDAIALQSFKAFESVVIDDGSDAQTREGYKGIWDGLDDRFLLHSPPFPGAPGTGPSAARNRGIVAARGEFVAFCDDDDHWNSPDHLEVGVRAMQACDADLYFANMRGESNGEVTIPDWFPNSPRLTRGKRVLDNPTVYQVSLPDMAATMHHHYPHPCGWLVRRSLLEEVGGFWERTDFGEDVDLALRLLDQCKRILYRPQQVISYNVSPRSSAFTRRSKMDQSLLCVMNAQHAESLCQDKGLRRCARSMESWHLRKIARHLIDEGRAREALSMAWRSVCVYPRLGGVAFLARVVGKSITGGKSGSGAES